jgi:hypothetical protein
VHVRMMGERRAPGVQHGGDADWAGSPAGSHQLAAGALIQSPRRRAVGEAQAPSSRVPSQFLD